MVEGNPLRGHKLKSSFVSLCQWVVFGFRPPKWVFCFEKLESLRVNQTHRSAGEVT
jgi:hypothetical protein